MTKPALLMVSGLLSKLECLFACSRVASRQGSCKESGCSTTNVFICASVCLVCAPAAWCCCSVRSGCIHVGQPTLLSVWADAPAIGLLKHHACCIAATGMRCAGVSGCSVCGLAVMLVCTTVCVVAATSTFQLNCCGVFNASPQCWTGLAVVTCNVTSL